MSIGKSPVSAILFDVDGTLIDTYHLYIESYRRALEPYLGRTPTWADVAGARPSSERHFLTSLVEPELVGDCHASMCRHYEELFATHAAGLYEGVREMLAHLRSAGFPLGIVTGKGRRAWEVTLRHVDLPPFDVVVTEDDAERPKPDPGGLLAATAALGLRPEEIAYVGDSLTDIEAARAAGIRPAAALWPKTAPGERDAYQADAIAAGAEWTFDRPSDISRTLAPWC